MGNWWPKNKVRAYFEKVLKKEPENYLAHYYLGKVKIKKQSIKHLNRALALKPDFVPAYIARAMLFSGANPPRSEFFRDLEKALNLDPGNIEALEYRALEYFNNHEYLKSVKDWTQVIKIDPAYIRAYFHRGKSRDGLGDFANAIKDYTRVIQMNGEKVSVYRPTGGLYSRLGDFVYKYRSLAYMELGNYDRVLDDFLVVAEKEVADKLDIYRKYQRGNAKRKRQLASFVEHYHKYESLVSQIKSFKQNKNYRLLDIYNMTIELFGNEPRTLFKRGCYYMQQGMFQKANWELRQLIFRKQKYLFSNSFLARIRLNLGLTYQKLDKEPAALKQYNLAIKLNPKLKEAYLYREQLARKNSSDIIEAAVDESPGRLTNPARFLFKRGMSYMQKDIYIKAEEDFKLILRKYKDSCSQSLLALIRLNLGIIYQRLNSVQKAIRQYNMAIKHNPELKMAYLYRGQVYEKDGNDMKAAEDYVKYKSFENKAAVVSARKKSSDSFASNPRILYKRGINYMKKGIFLNAIKDFELILRKHKYSVTRSFQAQVRLNLGIAYQKLNEDQDAMHQFNKVINLAPELKKAYLYRGQLYEKDGNDMKAAEDYVKYQALKGSDKAAEVHLKHPAIVSSDDPPGTLFKRGSDYLQKGMFLKAEANFELILKKHKRKSTTSFLAQVYLNLGITYQKQNEVQKALQQYNLAIKLHPGLKKAYLYRGKLYEEDGNDMKAAEDYVKYQALR
ncbi:tetratricopeptide repeat protein [Candidatus Riflebacteria bacterium]